MYSWTILALGRYPQFRVRPTWRHPDLMAMSSIAALSICTLTISAMVGMSNTPPLWALMIIPFALLLIASYYAVFRPNEQALLQIALYVALWIAMPLIALRITYLGSALAFPFQDATYAAADAAIGFQWIDWARFLIVHPALDTLAHGTYASSFYQPFLAVVLLAVYGKRSDNACFLIGTVIALLITAVPHTFWPSIGPAPANGMPNSWEDVVLNLREGHMSDLPYVGVVTFPSFHASMATLFTIAYRNVRFAIVPAACLNAIMLVSVLYPGGHYLVDVPAGVLIALVGWWIASRLVNS